MHATPCRSASIPRVSASSAAGSPASSAITPPRPSRPASRPWSSRAALRESLKSLEHRQPWETYREPERSIEAGVPALVTRRPGDGRPVPRYFALLLFGREPRTFLPGAFVVLSAYPGIDRSSARSELVPDVTGPIPHVVRRVLDWLQIHLSLEVDKSASVKSGLQNRPRYSRRAVEEAVVNALVHRDYALPDPVRISVFADRLEIQSPGGLPRQVSPEHLRAGEATASWRNAALATFMLRLGFAQGRGEGIPVILRMTRELTDKEPTFDFDAHWVKVTLPARRPRVAYQPASAGRPGSDGLLLVSVGAPTIRDQVLASLPALGLEGAPLVVDHAAPRYLESDTGDWDDEARSIRDALRDVVDRPDLHQFHLFYRGPVVLAPLLGALVARVKPLHVYTFEDGRYVLAYTLDRKFLRG